MSEQIPSEIEVAPPHKLLMLLITAYTEAYLHDMVIWLYGIVGAQIERRVYWVIPLRLP